MNVISHEDELVYLKPLSGPIFTNDVQQQIAERIGLQNESSLPSRKRGEESASFLRCKQHNGSRSLYHWWELPHLCRIASGGATSFMRDSVWWEPPHLCGGRSASALREKSRF